MKIDATALAARHPGVSYSIASTMVEAATVVLARRYDSRCELMIVDGDSRQAQLLEWVQPGDEIRNEVWADGARATEWGAEALAAMSVDHARGLVILSRAPRGTGADYYVGLPGVSLEHQTLLEVGGIDDGSIQAKLAEKRRQVAGNPDGLPAVAVAVRFREPCVMISDASEDRP